MTERACRGKGRGEHTGSVQVPFGHVKFEMAIKHLNGYAEWEAGIMFLELMGDLGTRVENVVASASKCHLKL